MVIFIFFLFMWCPKASYIVMDQDALKVLEGRDIHEKRLIASITKVMTAYVIIKEVDDLNAIVKVGSEINDAHGSNIYLKTNEEITIKDLLYGMMLRSGNDAATVLAYYLYNDVNRFVDLMNIYAKKIGMKNTLFQNPTGLDDDGTINISTAYDMALLTSKAMKDETFRKIFSTKYYSTKTNINSYTWKNKNKALFMKEFVTGGKTGFTKKARRTLITTASKKNMNITIVTLNVNDDFNFHVNKYNNIFKSYKKILILNKTNIKPIKSSVINFYVKDNYYMLTNNEKSLVQKLNIVYEVYDEEIKRKHHLVGKVVIYNNKDILYESPMYAKYMLS